MIPDPHVVSWRTLHDDFKARGIWDQTIVERTLARTGIRLSHSEEWEGVVVIIGGRGHASEIDAALIAQRINLQERVLLVVTSDEEQAFPWWEIRHPNMRLWVQTPRRWWDRTFGVGPSPHAGDAEYAEPEFDWFFAGQVTHEGRRRAVKALTRHPFGRLVETPGFTQGLGPWDYISQMAATKIAPAPTGPVTVDTFRLYEALENVALPIVDRKPPDSEDDTYWQRVYGDDFPIPVVDDWETLDMEALVGGWPANANRTASWWQRYQWSLAARFRSDLTELGAVDSTPFTVVVPTSPIPSHPDTKIIDETIVSIRERTAAPILVCIDGVRAEQEDRRADYEAYIRRVLWKCSHDWDAIGLVFDEHLHQAEMLRRVLPLVHTASLLYVEHDAPLLNEIPLDDLAAITDSGAVNLIRLHHEARILPDHEHLMLDAWDLGLPLTRTLQWSQRPHVANVDFYRRIIADHFTPASRTFIEDIMHGQVQSADWGRFRLAMYTPGGNIQRSGHTDGRGDQPKFTIRR